MLESVLRLFLASTIIFCGCQGQLRDRNTSGNRVKVTHSEKIYSTKTDQISYNNLHETYIVNPDAMEEIHWFESDYIVALRENRGMSKVTEFLYPFSGEKSIAWDTRNSHYIINNKIAGLYVKNQTPDELDELFSLHQDTIKSLRFGRDLESHDIQLMSKLLSNDVVLYLEEGVLFDYELLNDVSSKIVGISITTSGEECSHLSRFSSLRYLSLSGGRSQIEKCVDQSGGLSMLKQMVFSNVTTKVLLKLQEFDHLRSLTIEESQLSGDEFAALSRITQLRDVSINDFYFCDSDMRSFVDLVNLRKMKIWRGSRKLKI
jgi:hypothetical protein